MIRRLLSREPLAAFPRPKCSLTQSTIDSRHSCPYIRHFQFAKLGDVLFNLPVSLPRKRSSAYQLFTFANVLLCSVFLGPLSSRLQVLLIVVAINNRNFVILHLNHKIFVPVDLQEQHLLVATEWSVGTYLNSLPRSNDL